MSDSQINSDIIALSSTTNLGGSNIMWNKNDIDTDYYIVCTHTYTILMIIFQLPLDFISPFVVDYHNYN